MISKKSLMRQYSLFAENLVHPAFQLVKMPRKERYRADVLPRDQLVVFLAKMRLWAAATWR